MSNPIDDAKKAGDVTKQAGDTAKSATSAVKGGGIPQGVAPGAVPGAVPSPAGLAGSGAGVVGGMAGGAVGGASAKVADVAGTAGKAAGAVNTAAGLAGGANGLPGGAGGVLGRLPGVPGLPDVVKGVAGLVHGLFSRLPGEGTQFEFVAPPKRQGSLRVAAVSGREAISELFSLDILLSTSSQSEDLRQDLEETLLGQPAYLVIDSATELPRVVHGIVTSFTLDGASPELGRPGVRVTLAPRLWLATQRRRSRIFQDRTVQQVVDEVLEEWKVPRTWNVMEEFAPRPYCTQYDETDYEFVARLLAEEGIFFYFEPPEEVARSVKSPVGAPKKGAGPLTERIVLCDGSKPYPPMEVLGALGAGAKVAKVPVIDYYWHGEGLVGDQSVLEFALRREVRPNAALLTGYDWRNPAYKPYGGAGLPRLSEAERRRAMLVPGPFQDGELEVYTHHPRAEYEPTPKKAQGDAQGAQKVLEQKPQVDAHDAKKALDQLRREAYVGEGESRIWHLAPGHAFGLARHPLERLNHEYVVTEIEHSGRVPAMVKEAKEAYRNRFRCVPVEVRYRPAPPPRRTVQVAETATVECVGEEEICTDEYGRIRVRFHWDLADLEERWRSCWIRVAQPWAGAAFGQQFIPRVGAEVVVTFLRGDPDFPLVTGSVYNGANPMPFLVESKSRGGIRTATTPRGDGTGYNELSFEDADKNEEVRLRAQRNFKEDVLHDHTLTVGNERFVTVDRGQTETISVKRIETVLGPKTTTVTGERTETVGAQKTIVKGGRREEITLFDTRDVGDMQALTVHGDRFVWVDGALVTQVGTEKKPTETSMTVTGTHTTSATDQVLVTSKKEIVLECGDSKVTIGPEEVRIEAKRLVLVATESTLLKAKGPTVELTDHIEASAKALKLYSEGASLELTANADLNGAQVNMNCGGGSAKQSDVGSGPGEKQRPITMHLHDDDLKAFANKRYRLVAGGLTFDGTTDAKGRLSEKVPAEVTAGQVTVWIGEYPTGPTVRWPIELRDDTIPAPNTVEGALLRLRHLGYYHGEVAGQLTSEARAAIRCFQADHELEATGELDQATAGKLKDVHIA
jgi:type VI secretion system secreted protein VgrG